MFRIVERHPISHIREYEVRDGVTPHTERPALWSCAGNVDHGELALPRLAEPSLLGKLLHVASAITLGVCVRQRDPAPEGEQQSGHGDER